MGSEVCPLYLCAEGAHTHLWKSGTNIIPLRYIYPTKLPLLLQIAIIRCVRDTARKRSNRNLCKHGGKWLREAISHCCLLPNPNPNPNPNLLRPQDPQRVGGAPVRSHGGRGSSSGSPAAQAPQQMDGKPVLAHGVRVNGSLKGREFVLG